MVGYFKPGCAHSGGHGARGAQARWMKEGVNPRFFGSIHIGAPLTQILDVPMSDEMDNTETDEFGLIVWLSLNFKF